jgi:hypothetical protein
MKDDFASDHPLPLFLSGHDADEHEERSSLLLLNASILLLVASLVAMAIILAWGNPVKVFASVTPWLTSISAPQPGTEQSTPTVESEQSTPTVESAVDGHALPPKASGAPSRNENAAASEPGELSQSEISEPTSEALFKQFQAWAAVRAQVGQHVQDAPTQVVEDAPATVAGNAGAPVRPMQKHRSVRHVQDARAESRPMQKSLSGGISGRP